MEGLTGSYWVRIFGPALREARKFWPRTKDRMELRRHALKLRFWPEQNPQDESGVILDIDWEWIKSLQGKRVGELRIDDHIGGNKNIRLIFFVGPKDPRYPLPIIWILAAMIKKRNEFTSANIKTFEARRIMVLKRHYIT